jgi:hypothetical protein
VESDAADITTILGAIAASAFDSVVVEYVSPTVSRYDESGF